VFYTKYRPQKFSEVSKPNEAAEALANQVKSGKTVHAYLLVGPRGVGKTTAARILAKALNCSKVSGKGDPCGKCDSCQAIQYGNFVDLVEMDGASNRGIDDIRSLQDRINLAPTEGKHKVYIIDEVHMLTTQAFNALLKTLEEPPQNTTFILCTTESHKVPDTIKSRCQVFRLKRASMSQLVKKLSQIAKEEGAELSKDQLEIISRASLGGFRDAETLLQQVVEGEIEVDSLLNFASKETFLEFVGFLLESDSSGCLSLVDRLYEEGVDLFIWTGELLKYMRDVLFLKSGVSLNSRNYTAEFLEGVEKQSEKVSLEEVVLFLKVFSSAQADIKRFSIPQLPLELAIVEICGGGGAVTGSPDKPGGSVESVGKSKPSEPVSKGDAKNEKKTEESPEEKIAEKVNEKIAPISDTVEITILPYETVESRWADIATRMRSVNSSIMALLKTAKLIGMEGRFLILEVYFPFHKERLESTKNRTVLEGVLKETYGVPLGVRCVVSSNKPQKLKEREVGILTDMNIVPVGESIDPASIMDGLDGGLPM
jgi:DNA polymerase III subunit gamma/tau